MDIQSNVANNIKKYRKEQGLSQEALAAVGGATASDILALMHKVQDEVREQFGVQLEPEVRIIGED